VDLFARRLRTDGSFAWGGNTVNICTAAGSQDKFHIKGKDMYIYVTWADGRPGVSPGNYDIYAQKLDTTGYLYWNPDGLEAASFNTYIPHPILEVLDDYSIVIDHQSTIAGFMAQKVENDGTLPWGPDARQISTNNFNPFYEMHNLFQSGDNVITVWNKAAASGGSDGVYIARTDIMTGMKEPEAQAYFTVFPNPAGEKIEVAMKKELQNGSVHLFNATGQLIGSKEFSMPAEKAGFDVSSLAPGIYFVQVISASFVQEQKIIIR
jgi:hypothetical protein